MRMLIAAVLCLALANAAEAQDGIHFPPADRVTVTVMTDVPAVQLLPGLLARTVVGATGSVTWAEFDHGVATAAHHHTREQANVGISGVMEMTLGKHTEALPVGAAAISPANVTHSIGNKSGGKLASIEFHTVRRPDLVPPRPKPTPPFPAAKEPIAITDDSRLVAQLTNPADKGGGARTIQGETCTVVWRRLAFGVAPMDLSALAARVELFLYVVAGEAELTVAGVPQRVKAGSLILVPAGQKGATVKTAGTDNVAVVEFSPERR
jgi:quercetin dioxygenase-like cupin family protein